MNARRSEPETQNEPADSDDALAPGLVVRELRVSYPSHEGRGTVLDGVSLAVRPGEVYGLVGESGCGKSTLASALPGLLPGGGTIDGGSVLLDGVDVTTLDRGSMRQWRAGAFAMVHQGMSASLDPTVRVGDQVAEVCRLQGLSRTEARARAVDLLGQVRLPDPAALARRWPHQLSGGQQQRVGIAAALATRPRLLVLDEPTTGLDAAVEREVLDLLGALRRELDAAMLLISHDLALVARTCDRMGVLYAGRLVEEGAAAELVSAPAHPYTAGLVAAAPVLGRSRRDRRLWAVPGHPPRPTEKLTGCAFAPRCPLADSACWEREPSLAAEATVAGRLVRCYHSDQVGDLRGRSAPPQPVSPQAVSLQKVSPGPAAAAARRELLEVRGLSRRYGATAVLTDIDLDIGHGEVVGLVGESGSGKTTLARALAGIGPDGPGTIELAGQPLPARLPRRSAAQRRAVQMVFQDPDTTLNPRHTVGTVLRRALATLRGPDSVDDLATRVQVEARLLPMRSTRLSGGQKQRVAIARAFAGRPDLVICDEPVSALDVSVQAAILELLAMTRDATGASYLFVSHDLAVVGYLADRIAVLYGGRIVQQGPAGAVLAGPHHPYTANLLAGRGRPPIGSGTNPPTRRGPVTARTGCVYADHCPQRIEGVCDIEAPPLRQLGGPASDRSHTASCHLDPADLPTGEELD